MDIDHTEDRPAHGQDVTLDLNFVPTWAREPPGRNPYAAFEGEREGRHPAGRRPPGPGQPFDRKPRDRKPPGERRPFRPRGPAPVEPPREAAAPAPVLISFVPERACLGHLVRDLRTSGRAYPLADLAARFLAAPAYYRVKLETRRPAAGAEQARLYQCRECGLLFLDDARLASHALGAHLDQVYTREEQVVDPPAGNFSCVARCRLSGEVLGPPNHHEYNEKVNALWRARFAHMSLDEYRGRVETVRDPELIEQWKKAQSSRVVFRRKDAPEEPALSEADARRVFLEQYARKMTAAGHRFIIPAEVAQRLEDESLKRAVRETWTRESRHPFSVMLALRPAFHHMRLHVFKTQNQITFVTSIQPHPLEPRRAVKSIAEALHYLRRHPGCTRRELVEKLRPGMAADSPQAAAVLNPLRWLIERGHVIEFWNGTLSVPGVAGRDPHEAHPPEPAAPHAP